MPSTSWWFTTVTSSIYNISSHFPNFNLLDTENLINATELTGASNQSEVLRQIISKLLLFLGHNMTAEVLAFYQGGHIHT